MSEPGTAARAQIFNAREHAHLTPWLAGLQAQCITSDKFITAFRPPLSHEKLLGWWKDRIAEAAAGTRIIVMLLLDHQPGVKVQGENLIGVAMLAIPHLETAPFRATIESLLLSTKYRQRGGGTTLIRAVETQAILKGKTLLVRRRCSSNHNGTCSLIGFKQMAEMEEETPAAKLFMGLDYQLVGTVPNYSINPSGEMRGFVFLYKSLPSPGG